jgi:hypothetical protein
MKIEQTTAVKVFLDDIRPTPDGWIRTYSVTETIDLLQTGQVTELSLDHDLGVESQVGTGYDVLLWIEEQVVTNKFRPPVMVIHSDNAAGIARMRLAIESIKRLASRRGQ